MEETLEAAKFYTKDNAPHPFYLVQLTSTKELELDGNYVSDALVELIQNAWPPFSHVFLQTHGWNTPPDKAIKVPFSEFMAGMQNDPNVPQDEFFNPLFVAFTWEALPLKFMKEEDALKKTELLEESLRECELEDEKLVHASREMKRIIENGEKDDDFKTSMHALAEDDEEDDDDHENAFEAIDNDDDDDEGETEIVERGFSIRNPIFKLLDPFQRLVFGRLVARGRKTGYVLQGVIAKLMLARPDPTVKYCLMANSLGAHVVSGALVSPSQLPYKLHCCFIVQGAANSDWFGSDGKYSSITENVAGPIVCTVSVEDHLLRRVFKPFHGEAVGSRGFPEGKHLPMISKEEYVQGENSYDWEVGNWNSVEGSNFINDGDPFSGGHGDFKEDETTMTYWSAINAKVEKENYYTDRSPEVMAGEASVPQKKQNGCCMM